MALRSVLVASAAFLAFPGLATGFSTELQSVLKNTHRGDEYRYPTDFTRGIMPIPCHSHNDYWRDIPFYTGISKGCISTEADVWLYDGALYVPVNYLRAIFGSYLASRFVYEYGSNPSQFSFFDFMTKRLAKA
ncbi:hypothetical protein FE257_004830 [Aspergillus nanangensis]|uniref:Uncharacterized protein n=1 Tax=Aspergillus nanangensis TaxID=2582783 RepID=A0AAD4GVY0_ASPNN|nr:hypothetical protein FE257_004830 [Aspergillus nanangensis]